MTGGSSSGEDNSDVELQRAFAAGELQQDKLLCEYSKPKKEHVNHIAAMSSKLEEFQQKTKFKWIERMDVTCSVDTNFLDDSAVGGDEGDNVEDEFKREMLMYNQAQHAAKVALAKLKDLDIPVKRPEDYFAEMVKSDAHMKKVRQKLVDKQESLERSEKARQMREQKKYGKKIQHAILEQRQKEKKETMTALKQYRKGKKDAAAANSALDFLDDSTQKSQQRPNQVTQKKPFKKGKKRQYKDEKFGFGGQKKRSKYNTAESSADLSGASGFKRHVHGARPNKPGGGGGKPVKQKRLGKAARLKAKRRRK